MKQALLKTIVLVTATFVVVVAARGQGTPQAGAGRLRLESLERLAPKAAEAVNIEIDGVLIKFAGSMLSDEDADERAVKELITSLRGVYVRSYEFKSAGEFAEADVAAVREQLRAPGWSRVMDVKSKGLDFGEGEVYLATSGGRVEGFALLVVQPRELTVVNIVGALDLDKIRRLGDNFKLPGVTVKRKKKAEN
ncbi:MAG TPA: DUF4252 domain-containing protein [Pyrinomonadaceae bacterium]|nr:DUF4252 domain-containing protein [Pyrinomonadaceae bacterium]